MVQELIPGGGEAQFSYAALARTGAAGGVTARRTRQYPPDFGRASTCVETVDCPEIVPPALRCCAARLDRPRRGRVQARPARRAVQAARRQPARLGLAHAVRAGRGRLPVPPVARGCGDPVPRVAARPGVRWVRTTTDLPMVEQIVARRMSVARTCGRSAGRWKARSSPETNLAPQDSLEVPLLASILMQRIAHGSAV